MVCVVGRVLEGIGISFWSRILGMRHGLLFHRDRGVLFGSRLTLSIKFLR